MSENHANHQKRNIMIMFLSALHGKWLNDQKTIMKWDAEKRKYKICQPAPIDCKETNEAPMKDVSLTLGQPLDAVFYFYTEQVGRYPLPEGEALQERLTILSPPDYKTPRFYDSEAHFFWTERAPKVLGDLFSEKTRLFPVAFRESDSDPVASAIVAMTQMEKAIKAYLKSENVALGECSLYADITGGKRTANMAMSALMQLLQFEDVHLRRVVYSDLDLSRKGKDGNEPVHPVSNVQSIHDMYRLVAGVDAFKKYGSSAALKEFFRDEIEDSETAYPPLKNLLDAMDKFSGAVLLCQPDMIEGNLDKLMTALEAFPTEKREGETRPEKVELFARMLDDLKQLYTPMYPPPAEPDEARKMDRLEVIKWCVKNTLLQPAVTFCVEWLPEYFEEHGVAYTDNYAVQRYCGSWEFAGYRPGWKNFLMEFCTRSPAEPTKKNPSKTGLQKIAEFTYGRNVPRVCRTYDAYMEYLYSEMEDMYHGDMGISCRYTASVSRAMLECGLMETDCGIEKAVAYIRDYTYIRAEIRNKINHANEPDENGGHLIPLDIQEIGNYLREFLERVEEQSGKHHAQKHLWTEEGKRRWEENHAQRRTPGSSRTYEFIAQGHAANTGQATGGAE